MRERRCTWRALSVAVVFVAAAGAAHAEADGGGAPDGSSEMHRLLDDATTIVYVDGDHVVFRTGDHGHDQHDDGDGHVEAKGASTGNGPVVHEGFTTYGDAKAMPGYEILLVASRGVEQLRPYIEEAAAAAMAGGAPSLRVMPGTIAHGTELGRGQIHVTVSSSSPCTGSWLGCGGPIIEEGVVVAGRMWINPRLITENASKMGNTTRHELGHTLGLGHFNETYQGRTQTMHTSSFDAPLYEAGDLAGFRFVSGNEGPDPATTSEPPPAATARTPPAPSQQTNPSGNLEGVGSGPFGLVIRGWAFDPDSSEPVSVLVTIDGAPVEVLADRSRPDGSTNGFEVAHPVPPGTHEVCVIARNLGPGVDSSLGCHPVGVSARSIGRVGVQTV